MWEKFQKFNKWFAAKITSAVGTMGCAYLFTALSLVSLPSVLRSGNVIQIIAWITQTFLQLVLLSVLMVGQNIMGEASEKRSEETHQIVKTSHHEQMREMIVLRELLKDAQQERDEIKKLMIEMTQIMNAGKGTDNP